jgi:DNA-binding transcriptional MerR regulator
MGNDSARPAEVPFTGRRRYLRTAEVARAVGVHPNTVRLYETWGFLPEIPRSPSGYRLYTERHIDLMRLARTALHYPYPGGKGPVLGLVSLAGAGDLDGALALARRYLDQVKTERGRAEAAAELLERWARGDLPAANDRRLRIGAAAQFMGITVDALRNWERNGLIEVPQDPRNRYRYFGSQELNRLLVIRTLRAAGYGTNAILRMLIHLDQWGEGNLRAVLDTPPQDEDVIYWTDRWLSTLAEQGARAERVIALLEEMRSKSLQ